MLLGKAAEGRRSPRRCAQHDDSLKSAKRLGLRQSSGVLQEDEMSARFPHELLYANDNIHCYKLTWTGRKAGNKVQIVNRDTQHFCCIVTG